LLAVVPQGGDMAQRAGAGDRQAVAEPRQHLGRGKTCRQLRLGVAIEPNETGPVGIGVNEGRQLAEGGIRVSAAEVEPGDDLVGQGMGRTLPRQGEAAVGIPALEKCHGSGIALAVRLAQRVGRPPGQRPCEDRRSERGEEKHDRNAPTCVQDHQNLRRVSVVRRG